MSKDGRCELAKASEVGKRGGEGVEVDEVGLGSGIAIRKPAALVAALSIGCQLAGFKVGDAGYYLREACGGTSGSSERVMACEPGLSLLHKTGNS